MGETRARLGDVVTESRQSSPYTPPSVFALLKWKSDKKSVPASVKWRNLVSFASHPLKGWSKPVGRCLRLLIKEMTVAGGSVGF